MSSQSFFFNPTETTAKISGRAFSVPSTTTAGRLALGLGPADFGMQVYDTTLNQEFLWTGTAWVAFAGTSGVVDSFANVAALKAFDFAQLATDQSVLTSGYYSAGDGGSALYWVDKTDTTSADNGGSVIVAADGTRLKLVPTDDENPARWGCIGTAYAGVSIIQDTADSVMNAASTARFNWVNQSWQTFTLAGGNLSLTETAAAGNNQAYLNGILPGATTASGSAGLVVGRSYTVRLNVALSAGTAHTLWIGQSRAPSLVGFTIPAAKINGTSKLFCGTFVAVNTGPVYIGLLNDADASGSVYLVDNVQLCLGTESWGVEIASITRVGTTATVTTVTPHGFASGQTKIISGVIGAAVDSNLYNGSQVITVTGTSTFTYILTAVPAANAVLGWSFVLPDDTVQLQRCFDGAQGRRIVFPAGRQYAVSNATELLPFTTLDLCGGRIAYYLVGNRRGMVMSYCGTTLQNGELNVVFGTGATSPDGDIGDIQAPLSLTNITAIGQEDGMTVRNIRLGGSSDKTVGVGVYALNGYAPRAGVFENITILDGTFVRGLHFHWQKVNLNTAGVYPPRKLVIRNIRVGTLSNATFPFTTALYLSNASGVEVENFELVSAANAIYIVGGDILDGYDFYEALGKDRCAVRISNFHAKSVSDTAVLIDGKSITNDIAYSTGDATVNTFTLLNVTDSYGFPATQLFKAGDRIFGTGIPYGTVVQSVAGNTVTMNRRATATNAGITVNRVKENPIVIEDSLFIGIQGVSGNNYGFKGGDNGNIQFNRVEFRAFLYAVNLLGPGATAPWCSTRNTRFDDCIFRLSWQDGTIIRGARQVWFNRCRWIQNGQQTANTYQNLKFDGSSGGYLPDIDGVSVDKCQFGSLGVTETAKWAIEITYSTRTKRITLTNNIILANGSTGECIQWTTAGSNSGHDCMEVVANNDVHPSLNIPDFYSGLTYIPCEIDTSTRRRKFKSRVTLTSANNPTFGSWYVGDRAESQASTAQGARNSLLIRTSGTGGPDPGPTATTTIGDPWILTTNGDLFSTGMVVSVLGGYNGGIITDIDSNWIKVSSNPTGAVAGVVVSLTAFAIRDAGYVPWTGTAALAGAGQFALVDSSLAASSIAVVSGLNAAGAIRVGRAAGTFTFTSSLGAADNGNSIAYSIVSPVNP